MDLASMELDAELCARFKDKRNHVASGSNGWFSVLALHTEFRLFS
jgi:hypothetical protein